MKLLVQQAGVREIKVKLLLAGGHAAMISLPPDHPLLAQLLATVAPAARGQAPQPTTYQIPVDGGRASLAFGSHQLIGVVTDPAVLVQHDDNPSVAPASAPQIAPEQPRTAAMEASAASPSERIVRHPVARLDGFLTATELAWLMETVFAAESRFVPSAVSDSKADYRQSFVLQPPDELVRMVTGKIRAAMPEVMAKLRMGEFPVGQIECQVTANTDGSFFRVHTDAGPNDTVKRQLTYVYYFNREPKGFSGGELRVYDDRIRNGKLAKTDTYQTIEPLHNSIVFFQAPVMHEVTPVQVPSKQFRDSRFTVNGWVHRT